MSLPAPFRHQVEGMGFVNTRPFSMLAHDPGTGKTRTAIMVLDANADADNTLVLCPATALGVWKEQAEQWGFEKRAVTIVDKPSFVQGSPFGGITICSYGMISKHPKLVENLTKGKWDVLICDEAHKLKSPRSRRTKAVLGPRCRNNGIAASASKVVFLTGTPVLGTPDELWPFLRAFAPKAINKSLGFDDFQHRYCVIEDRWIGGNYIPDVTTAKREMMPELRRILSPYVHFARWQDVQKDLPPLIWQHFPMKPDVLPLDVVRATQEVWDHCKRAGYNPKDDDSLLSYLKTSAHIATYRRMVGLMKASMVVEAVKDDFEGGVNKVLIFAHHHEVIKHIAESLRPLGIVTLTGNTPNKARAEIVHEFQTNKACGIFLGQTQAAGEIITLTAARLVYLVEPDFTPATNWQAAKRAHRQGQHNSVQVRVCSLYGTLDASIGRILTRKCETIEAITGADLRMNT